MSATTLMGLGGLLSSSHPSVIQGSLVMYASGAARVLEALVDGGEMTAADASRVAGLIGEQNARRVYGLAADGRS